MMIRTLYPSPGAVDFGQLRSQLAAVAPIIDCNDVAGQVAVYTDGHPTAGFAAVVAAHVPAPPVQPVDPVVALASALLDAQSLEEVRAAAQAALTAAGGA